MRVVQRYGVKEADKPTPKQAVNEKMRVLREFYVIDNKNADEVKAMLEGAIRESPNRDYEIVLDQVARKLISNKLNGGE